MNNLAVRHAYKEQDLLPLLWAQKLTGMTLRAIANEYGNPITYGDISRCLHGKFPLAPCKREKLNLVSLGTGETCPKCGQVHTTKRCTANKPAPRVNWRAELGQVIASRLSVL